MVFTKEYIELNWTILENPTAKMSVGDIDNDGDFDLAFLNKVTLMKMFLGMKNINGKFTGIN